MSNGHTRLTSGRTSENTKKNAAKSIALAQSSVCAFALDAWQVEMPNKFYEKTASNGASTTGGYRLALGSLNCNAGQTCYAGQTFGQPIQKKFFRFSSVH